jgi:hypothetical protein
MDRSVLAPLSPNEELALRRIAHGIAGLRELSKRDVNRLLAFNLIAGDGATVSVTRLGLERLAHLPHGGANELPKRDATIDAMAKALGVRC